MHFSPAIKIAILLQGELNHQMQDPQETFSLLLGDYLVKQQLQWTPGPVVSLLLCRGWDKTAAIQLHDSLRQREGCP